MRLRNVKNKDQILSSSPFFIADGSSYKGKWHRLFGNDRPIYLEIGMGKGKFLIENAIRYPEINFIGIERYDSVLARALEKVPEDLKNIKIVRLNAEYIEKLFDHEISLIYLNFSDPWPKKKHHRRRLTSLEFLGKYDTIFQTDAVIVQKTDNADLFAYSLCCLSQYGYVLEDVSLDYQPTVEDANIETEYEERFRKLHLPIYRLIAKKKR